MTTPTPRWTAETTELVYREIGYFLIQEGALSRLDDFAEHILAALADAGVLIPVGGETRQEWGVLHETFGVDGPLTAVDGNHEALARRMAAASSLKLVQRTVGPWREVTDDPA